MRDVEYDRFGPWVLEIDDVDLLPPVFVPHVPEGEEALIRIKVPRNKERRDLRPGDHMYDYLVSLFEDRLEVLARERDSVARFCVKYVDILALRHLEDLLNGHLVIYTPDRDFDLPYSTVSVELIKKVLRMIRKRYTGESPGMPVDLWDRDGDPAAEDLGFFFSHLVNERQHEEPAGRLVGLQAERKMHTVSRGFLRTLFFGAVDKRLLESIHYLNDREVEIINRGQQYAYRWQAVYAKETLYIPRDRLRDIHREMISSNETSELELDTEGSRHYFHFLKDNPVLERYRAIMDSRN